MKKVKCLNCSHEQVLIKEKIYQDINGKFMVCEECDGSFDVEFEEDYFSNSVEKAQNIIKEGFKKDLEILHNMGNKEINKIIKQIAK
jgi:transcription elongation factor Elf1